MERTNVPNACRIRATGLGQWLDDRGIKYVWLAGKIGISKTQMSGIISGRLNVNPEHAERVCETLGVPFFTAFECTKEGISRPVGGRSF